MMYKLLRPDEWAVWKAQGAFAGSALDLKDGFVHMSTAQQAQETATKHFQGVKGLVLAELDPSLLVEEALKWETSRGGALFPHHYAPLPLAAITRVWEVPLAEGGVPILPDL